jgi:hypothetical protein
MAQDTQERILHGVFCIGTVTQDGKCNAVKRSSVLANHCRESLLIGLGMVGVRTGSFVHSALGNLHPT